MTQMMRVMMTLSDYLASMKARIALFEAYWLENAKSNPEHWADGNA